MKLDARLPGKGNSNSHGARPVHLIITMIKWIRTSRLSIQNSLFPSFTFAGFVPGNFDVRHPTDTNPRNLNDQRTSLGGNGVSHQAGGPIPPVAYRGTSPIRNCPPQDPTVGICLGPYAGPRGILLSCERGTPVPQDLMDISLMDSSRNPLLAHYVIHGGLEASRKGVNGRSEGGGLGTISLEWSMTMTYPGCSSVDLNTVDTISCSLMSHGLSTCP